MKTWLKNIVKLIPSAKRKRLPPFLFLSLLNSFLDFVSIAFLTPFILILIDKQKAEVFMKSTFGLSYEHKHIVFAIVLLILFYVLKNALQTKITNSQNRFLYGIGSQLSHTLVRQYVFGNYESTYQSNKGDLILDFHRLPIIFATNILIPISNILVETTILLLIVIAGMVLNPFITSMALVFVLFSVVGLFYFRNSKTKRINKTISTSYSKTLTNLMNIIDGIIEIKGAKSENKFVRRFNQTNEAHNSTLAELSTFKQNNIKYLEIITISIIAFSVLFMMLGSGALKDVLLLSFFASAIIKIIPSFNRIINAIVDIKSNIHCVEALNSYPKANESNLTPIAFQKHISFENLYFNYPEKPSIIHKLDLKISKSDFMVLSGVSGCGKTTLLHIIAGYLRPAESAILVDGANIKLENYAPEVYLVSQDPKMFQGSLLDNITMYQNGTIDLELIWKLLKKTGLSKWAKTLPNGLSTEFNLDSKHLSGGQKQRIALVRALYAKPKLLLLDEATNQLNTELESEILSFLKDETLKTGMTIVSVFHNQNALKYATKHYGFEGKTLIEK